MQRPYSFITLTTLFVLPIVYSSPLTYANGLDDVKQALARNQQSAPFSAKVNASIKNLNKEDDEQKATEGSAYYFIDQGPSGLAIRYTPELLASITRETQAKKKTHRRLHPPYKQ